MKNQEPEYTIIDAEQTTESTDAWCKKILKQVPKGKAMILHDENQTLESKTLVQIINPRDIPPENEITKTKKSYKVTETKDSKRTRHANRKETSKTSK
jgi:hypothetical protein